MKIYPKENIIRFFWLRIFPMAVLYNLTAEFHYYALNFTAPADVTAVFASVLALVYILSMIFLKEPLILIRVIYYILYINNICVKENIKYILKYVISNDIISKNERNYLLILLII